MRDASTVARGERVYVSTGLTAGVPGVFVGVHDGQIVVDHTVTIIKVTPGGDDTIVTDAAGRVLGILNPDPDLSGSPPDLE